jgi:hypothetical protein
MNDPASTVFDDPEMAIEKCHFFVGDEGGGES